MRIALGELAPTLKDVPGNERRVAEIVRAVDVDLAVFPELFLSGYRLGDDVHRLALDRATLGRSPVAEAVRETGRSVIVGAPLRSADRPGEVENAALLFRPDAPVAVQVKRYLPTYGPFEEGTHFTPSDVSLPLDLADARVGLEICYDTFFPEVSRELALAGAILLVSISASPVTSLRLFEKILPARAVENAVPVVYVNRIGTEDGLVFGGGSGIWDARGEPVPLTATAAVPGGGAESVLVGEVDLSDAPRWRPFRPVLRDRSTRPGPVAARAAPRRWT